jgi:hypothetical protein
MRRRVPFAFFLLLLTACGIDPQKFQSVDLAGREIIVALNTDTSPGRLRELRAAFGSALQAVEPLASSNAERTLTADFRSAGAALDDLLAVLDLRITTGTELLPVSNPLAERVWKAYDLPINTNEPPSIYASEAVREIQAGVRAKLAAASDTLNQ